MGDIAGFGFPQQTLTNSNVKKHNFLCFQRSACQDILNIVAFQKGFGSMAILTLSDRKPFTPLEIPETGTNMETERFLTG